MKCKHGIELCDDCWSCVAEEWGVSPVTAEQKATVMSKIEEIMESDRKCNEPEEP